MLERVDRIQVAVTDRDATAAAFTRLLGAEAVREDAITPLGARRTVLRLGAAEVELLAADGAGAVADHLRRVGPGLFAGGFASSRIDELRARLVRAELAFTEAEGQLFLPADATGGHGLRCVLSPSHAESGAAPRAAAPPPAAAPAAPSPATTAAPSRDASVPRGLVSFLYEVTNLVEDAAAASHHYAALFGLEEARFCPIESAAFGYRGVLTLFDPAERLDRIECITPSDLAKTMGRFMRKRGESLYMCFAEAPDLAAITARLEEHAPHDWSAGTPAEDTLFVHPRALSGLLLGISRETVGWLWSGHPERVQPVRASSPRG